MFGAFLTFMLLTLVLGTRQEKERLSRQLGSRVNAVALQATEELRAHGWLEDGSLQGVVLDFANLQGAMLKMADLQKTWINHANLRGANLEGAYLQGAYLTNVSFDENTILPDGSKWSPDTDMGRYTNPNHPQFLRHMSRSQGRAMTKEYS
jgi:hypothetical protein